MECIVGSMTVGALLVTRHMIRQRVLQSTETNGRKTKVSDAHRPL